jgi:predicted alpha/beta superfamily hydrolase
METSQFVSLDFLPSLAGGYFPHPSRATNRTYHIYVRLPQDYAASPAKKYPVVYVLDGDSLFPLLAATHLFLTIDDKLPEAIVVGIAYGSFDPLLNKRRIDFMPPSPSLPIEQSGAYAFQRFLEDELVPKIEQYYQADPSRRVLFGQSRGGSFVLYSAFTHPDYFWGRIASNPALPPTRDFFYQQPAAAKRNDLRLFVAEGPGDLPELRAETVPWLAAQKGRTNNPWKLTSIEVRDGTHSANSPDAYRAAMRDLMGWKPHIATRP